MSTITSPTLSSLAPATVTVAIDQNTSSLVNRLPLRPDIHVAFIGAGLGIAYAYMDPSSLLTHIVTPIAGAALGAIAGSVTDMLAREVHQYYFTHYYKPYILNPEISRVLAPIKKNDAIDIDTVLEKNRSLMETVFFFHIKRIPGYHTWTQRNNLHSDNDAFIHLQNSWGIGTCFGQNQEIIRQILTYPQRPLPQILKLISIENIFVSQTKHEFEISNRLDSAVPHSTDLENQTDRAEFSSELKRAVRGETIRAAKTCSFNINNITADTILKLLSPLDHLSTTNPYPVIISLKMLWGITPEICETIETTIGAERASLLAGIEAHTMLLFCNCGNPGSLFYLYNSLRPHNGLFEFRDLETCSQMLYALAKHRVRDIEDLDRLDLTLERNRAIS